MEVERVVKRGEDDGVLLARCRMSVQCYRQEVGKVKVITTRANIEEFGNVI